MGVRADTYEWLKAHIVSLPRDKGVFLTESEVAKAAGASRTPVREALTRLESEGMVERIPQRGAYVPPIADSEISAVMDARGMVERWCVERALGESGTIDLAELDDLLERQRSDGLDRVTFVELDREFHTRIVAAAGNTMVSQFYAEMRDLQLRMGVSAVTATEDRTARVVEEHRCIVEAIRRRDVESALSATTAHLTNTLKAMI